MTTSKKGRMAKCNDIPKVPGFYSAKEVCSILGIKYCALMQRLCRGYKIGAIRDKYRPTLDKMNKEISKIKKQGSYSSVLRKMNKEITKAKKKD